MRKEHTEEMHRQADRYAFLTIHRIKWMHKQQTLPWHSMYQKTIPDELREMAKLVRMGCVRDKLCQAAKQYELAITLGTRVFDQYNFYGMNSDAANSLNAAKATAMRSVRDFLSSACRDLRRYTRGDKSLRVYLNK